MKSVDSISVLWKPWGDLLGHFPLNPALWKTYLSQRHEESLLFTPWMAFLAKRFRSVLHASAFTKLAGWLERWKNFLVLYLICKYWSSHLTQHNHSPVWNGRRCYLLKLMLCSGCHWFGCTQQWWASCLVCGNCVDAGHGKAPCSNPPCYVNCTEAYATGDWAVALNYSESCLIYSSQSPPRNINKPCRAE
jgi:hypothetical protein